MTVTTRLSPAGAGDGLRCNPCLHKVNWLKTGGCSLGGCVSSSGDVVVMWWRGGEDNDGGVYSGKSTYYRFTILFHITQQHIKAYHNGPVLVLCKSLEKKSTINHRSLNFFFCSFKPAAVVLFSLLLCLIQPAPFPSPYSAAPTWNTTSCSKPFLLNVTVRFYQMKFQHVADCSEYHEPRLRLLWKSDA